MHIPRPICYSYHHYRPCDLQSIRNHLNGWWSQVTQHMACSAVVGLVRHSYFYFVRAAAKPLLWMVLSSAVGFCSPVVNFHYRVNWDLLPSKWRAKTPPLYGTTAFTLLQEMVWVQGYHLTAERRFDDLYSCLEQINKSIRGVCSSLHWSIYFSTWYSMRAIFDNLLLLNSC